MSWQVVVARSAWQAIRINFSSWWKAGRAAYRRLNKTKAAPTITEDAEPSYGGMCLEHRGQMGNSRTAKPSYVYRTRNTFIDTFDVVEGASESDLEAILSC
mmetsp:Transcript_15036/g.26332  ORF Transcript_15036/g.26332 Transcript_15036/m.26332 type:complete len:101 (-) Transcript_15036:97-399(-)